MAFWSKGCYFKKTVDGIPRYCHYFAWFAFSLKICSLLVKIKEENLDKEKKNNTCTYKVVTEIGQNLHSLWKTFHIVFPSRVGTVFSYLNGAVYTNLYGFLLYYTGKDYHPPSYPSG